MSLDGVLLERAEYTWTTDDQPGSVPASIQRWTGPEGLSVRTRTSRETEGLGDLLAGEVFGELLGRAMVAGWSKTEMRSLPGRAAVPEEADSVVEVDGRAVPGVRLPPLATPLGEIRGAAARLGRDTLVVIVEGAEGSRASVRTTPALPGEPAAHLPAG